MTSGNALDASSILIIIVGEQEVPVKKETKLPWLSPWLRRPLPLFIFAHFSHDLCPALLVPLLPLMRDAFGLTYFEAGLLVSTYTITSGISQLLMGWLADRLNRRIMLVVGLGGMGTTSFLAGLTQNLPQLLVIFFVMGLVAGIYHPTSISIFPRYFPKERRGRAVGVHLIGGSAGFLLAPVLGGLIAWSVGWRFVYTVLALPALALVPFLIQQAKRPEPTPEEAHPSVATPSLSLGQALRPILFIFILGVTAQLIAGGVVAYLPLFLVDRHAVLPAVAAMLVGFERGGNVLGSFLGGVVSDRWGRKPGVLLSVITTGPLIVLMILVPFGALLLGIFALLGVILHMRQPAMQSLIVDAIPEHRTSTLLGLYFFLSMEGRSLMVPVVGYLMDVLGMNNTFLYLALAALALSTVAFFYRKRV